MKIKEYIQKLATELTDKHNLFNELMLAWIAIMLTSLVAISLIYLLFGG